MSIHVAGPLADPIDQNIKVAIPHGRKLKATVIQLRTGDWCLGLGSSPTSVKEIIFGMPYTIKNIQTPAPRGSSRLAIYSLNMAPGPFYSIAHGQEP